MKQGPSASPRVSCLAFCLSFESSLLSFTSLATKWSLLLELCLRITQDMKVVLYSALAALVHVGVSFPVILNFTTTLWHECQYVSSVPLWLSKSWSIGLLSYSCCKDLAEPENIDIVPETTIMSGSIDRQRKTNAEKCHDCCVENFTLKAVRKNGILLWSCSWMSVLEVGLRCYLYVEYDPPDG